MGTVRDFQMYVSLYEGLKRRYISIQEVGNREHEIFEMNFLELESNAWIPRFICDKQNAVIFSWGEFSVEYVLNELCRMEQNLNALSNRKEH